MKAQKKVSMKLMDFARHFEAVPQGYTGERRRGMRQVRMQETALKHCPGC